MKKSAIKLVLSMVEDLLSGEMDMLDFRLDFSYHVTKQYKKMCREDAEYADLIYYYLVEEGADKADGLSDEEILALMKRQYENVLEGVY